MGDRLKDGEKTANINELSDFRNYWRDSPEYPDENRANDHIYYPVDVTYSWADGRSSMEFSSVFRAFVGAGPEDGRVDIDDTTKVRIEEFHLRFNPRFQTYTYDQSDHALVITDSSPKMGGNYEVRIKPNIEEP